jgi:DNA-binding PadR family transcriptional regulator
MRRKEGALLPIEIAILESGVGLDRSGEREFHGSLMAKRLRDRDEARRLTAHGTLYKALDRLEKAGMLTSRWEDPDVAAAEGRPRRRLYRVTGLGERAAADSLRDTRRHPSRPGLEPA